MKTIGLIGGMSWESTEIGLLIGQGDADIPIFDTSVIHARRAAEMALED